MAEATRRRVVVDGKHNNRRGTPNIIAETIISVVVPSGRCGLIVALTTRRQSRVKSSTYGTLTEREGRGTQPELGEVRERVLLDSYAVQCSDCMHSSTHSLSIHRIPSRPSSSASNRSIPSIRAHSPSLSLDDPGLLRPDSCPFLQTDAQSHSIQFLFAIICRR